LVLVAAISLLAYLVAAERDVRVTEPIDATVVFVGDASKLSDAGIATDCAGLTVSAVIVGGSLQKPLVVTDDSRCQLNQVAVPSETAVVIPKVK
jgi:phosphohistidine swiveling domain-containing protein